MYTGKVFGVLGLLFGLLLVYLPAYAQQGNNTNPNFVFINYIGQEVVLDLDDVTYIVPGTAISPDGGRFELTLAPGEHKYAANVPGVDTGSAGTFIITAGGSVGKAARLEKTNALFDRDGNVLEKPKDYVFIFDVDPFAAEVSAAPTAAVVDTWKPAPATPGQGSLAWTNYTGEELTIDLNGTLYKVPPAANNIPGHSQIEVAPGLYRYTASVPNGSVNGEVNLIAGQVMGLTVSAKLLEEQRYDVGEPAPQVPPVDLLLTQEDLTAQAVVVTAPTTAVAPAPTPATNPAEAPAPVAAKGVLIKNYTGDTLIFTINNQAYAILNNEQMTLLLPPGSYNYTASLPYVATTGTVNMAVNQGIELSVAINLNHDLLSIYQN